MTTTEKSAETKAQQLERVWAATGTLGRLILLTGNLFSGVFTVNASTDIVTAAGHTCVTGTRVRLTTTGTLPVISGGTLSSSVDYFAILDGGNLKLATTLANALAGTAINFTDTGSGTHTLTEQRLNSNDPISVLISKELSHPSYARQVIADIGEAAAVGVRGEIAPISYTYSASGSNLVFRHVLIIRGGSSTIGDTTGTEPELTTETADVVFAPGAPKIITIVIRQ